MRRPICAEDEMVRGVSAGRREGRAKDWAPDTPRWRGQREEEGPASGEKERPLGEEEDKSRKEAEWSSASDAKAQVWWRLRSDL